MNAYNDFIRDKTQWSSGGGFNPGELPSHLFDFQTDLVNWSCGQGRAAIFADCGLGKTPMQLAWAQKVVEKTNKPVLIATPLAVGGQTLQEATKFGVEAERSRDGTHSGAKLWITNYEQLHKFDPLQFAGMVCDESSCIKDFKSKRKDTVVEFMRRLEYRLLCTATAAPNDYWELGTSSEALGKMGFRDMITKFFKQETTKDRLGWGRTKYRFRGHADSPFWAWVCSWARSIRRPSDLGYDESRFVLPELIQREYVVETAIAREGMLFHMPARDMREEREERRNTIAERCEMAADLANNHEGSSAVWCNLNPEGALLSRLIKDSVEVSGAMSDEQREEAFTAFSNGQVKRIITKAKIGAWGLNWQHCDNIVAFPTHSFEQMYQLVRRCYRFGQKNNVKLSLVLSEGESQVLDNLKRKQRQADRMFELIVKHMKDALHLLKNDSFPEKEKLPSWL